MPSVQSRHYDYYTDLVSDPDKTQFVHDVMVGQKPHVPTDEALRARYMGAANILLRAQGSERETLQAVVRRARASVYTDEDFARADHTT